MGQPNGIVLLLPFLLQIFFLELIIAFVLFHFIFCFFSVFIKPFANFCQELQHLYHMLRPISSVVSHWRLLFLSFPSSCSVADYALLWISLFPLSCIQPRVFFPSFWYSTFSSSFLEKRIWEESFWVYYLSENVFIQIS